MLVLVYVVFLPLVFTNPARDGVSKATMRRICEMPEFQEAMARDEEMEPAAIVYEALTNRMSALEGKILDLEKRLEETPTRAEFQAVAAALRTELIGHVDNRMAVLSGELGTNVELILSNLMSDLSALIQSSNSSINSTVIIENFLNESKKGTLTATTEPLTTTTEQPWKDCAYLATEKDVKSGVHVLYLNDVMFEAYCDFVESQNGREGWLVIQRRVDYTMDFFRKWSDYKNGFGDKMGNFYFGNEDLHYITNQRNYQMEILLGDFFGSTASAQYANFTISDEQSGYTLDYSSFLGGNAGDGLKSAKGRKFSTKDMDNDNSMLYSCSKLHHGAFWYDKCGAANLNGVYPPPGRSSAFTWQNIIWYPWRNSLQGMKKVEMRLLLT